LGAGSRSSPVLSATLAVERRASTSGCRAGRRLGSGRSRLDGRGRAGRDRLGGSGRRRNDGARVGGSDVTELDV